MDTLKMFLKIVLILSILTILFIRTESGELSRIINAVGSSFNSVLRTATGASNTNDA